MRAFSDEFRNLSYIVEKSFSFLLVAHTRPDADTVGAVLAFSRFLKNKGKEVSIACYDPFPPGILKLLQGDFLHPDQIRIENYEVIIGCDSVDRGFHQILPRLQPHQATVIIDHHPDINIKGDVNIIDTHASSTCEILFTYFEKKGIISVIDKEMATMLLAGLLFDTGNLQHACTTSRVMDIAGILIKKGAPLGKVIDTIFNNKSISALRLWGRAFERSVLNDATGMITTAITQKDIEECEASPEDIYHVASILSTVPEAKFSLVLSERNPEVVRAHLRSMARHNVDVSAIAQKFGGGGHRLASGFEIPGRISQNGRNWVVE